MHILYHYSIMHVYMPVSFLSFEMGIKLAPMSLSTQTKGLSLLLSGWGQSLTLTMDLGFLFPPIYLFRQFSFGLNFY